MPPAAAAGIGLGLSAIGTVFSVKQQREQAKAQRRANRMERKAQQVRARRERVKAFQEQRRAQAMATAQAGAMGGGAGLASSAFQGAIGAIGSNTAESVGFANQIDSIAQRQSEILQRGADRASMFGTLAGVARLGGQVASSETFQGML